MSRTAIRRNLRARQDVRYASPLQAIRLRNRPPVLIPSVEGALLRDDADKYGKRLVNRGVRTTVCRLPAA
jgi:acetyl esterase/lipase